MFSPVSSCVAWASPPPMQELTPYPWNSSCLVFAKRAPRDEVQHLRMWCVLVAGSCRQSSRNHCKASSPDANPNETVQMCYGCPNPALRPEYHSCGGACTKAHDPRHDPMLTVTVDCLKARGPWGDRHLMRARRRFRDACINPCPRSASRASSPGRMS